MLCWLQPEGNYVCQKGLVNRKMDQLLRVATYYYETETVYIILLAIILLLLFLFSLNKPHLFTPRVLIYPFDLDSCIFLTVILRSVLKFSGRNTLTGFWNLPLFSYLKEQNRRYLGSAFLSFYLKKAGYPISENFCSLLSKRQWLNSCNMVIPNETQCSIRLSSKHRFLYSFNTEFLSVSPILTCFIVVFRAIFAIIFT
jgi:hypothetical protein